jgi:hypothetical protein
MTRAIISRLWTLSNADETISSQFVSRPHFGQCLESPLTHNGAPIVLAGTPRSLSICRTSSSCVTHLCCPGSDDGESYTCRKMASLTGWVFGWLVIGLPLSLSYRKIDSPIVEHHQPYLSLTSITSVDHVDSSRFSQQPLVWLAVTPCRCVGLSISDGAVWLSYDEDRETALRALAAMGNDGKPFAALIDLVRHRPHCQSPRAGCRNTSGRSP